MITVDFQHWKHRFGQETLIQYGSPHYDERRARFGLLQDVEPVESTTARGTYGLSRMHLACANEVFPEAAVADPVADLEVWQEWQDGTREFPYPGQYSRLGISGPSESKTSSPSSVGVIGEVAAGLFAQAFVGPWVIVRVIRRWPDFIFYNPKADRYSFVESKAFTTTPKGEGILSRVPGNLLGECLREAVYQLNADPSLRVWGAFTHVASVSPMHLNVTFLQLSAPDALKSTRRRVVPASVVHGMARRSVAKALHELTPEQRSELGPRKGRKPKARTDVEASLKALSRVHLESLLTENASQSAIGASRRAIDKELTAVVQAVKISWESQETEGREGERFRVAKVAAARGEWAEIRSTSLFSIEMRDLSDAEKSRIESRWRPSWDKAVRPWGDSDQMRWRCGGALFRARLIEANT